MDTNYHLNLKLGQSDLTKLQDPTALFEFTLKNPGDATEKLCIEFNHDELFSFFNDLELVQQQLDQLSSAAGDLANP